MNIFDAISRKMAWLGQRQSVLAQNIANADTPNYVPQDLKSSEFARKLQARQAAMAMAATHRNHLDSRSGPAALARSDEQSRTYEVAPSGNAVVLEEQMIKVGETQMNYRMLSNLYRRHMNMMRAALGRGS